MSKRKKLTIDLDLFEETASLAEGGAWGCALIGIRRTYDEAAATAIEDLVLGRGRYLSAAGVAITLERLGVKGVTTAVVYRHRGGRCISCQKDHAAGEAA